MANQGKKGFVLVSVVQGEVEGEERPAELKLRVMLFVNSTWSELGKKPLTDLPSASS